MVDDNNPGVPDEESSKQGKPGPVIKKPGSVAIGGAPGKLLSDAAKRALEEAATRRIARDANSPLRPDETAGPKGAEPTRYGDWERGGIAYDF